MIRWHLFIGHNGPDITIVIIHGNALQALKGGGRTLVYADVEQLSLYDYNQEYTGVLPSITQSPLVAFAKHKQNPTNYAVIHPNDLIYAPLS